MSARLTAERAAEIRERLNSEHRTAGELTDVVEELLAELALIRGERDCLATAVVFANQWTDAAPTGLREGIAQILTTMPGDDIETDLKGQSTT
ncbi:hypothetical protein [Streptomyces sp. Da 82-17]|uniref:hypothetical protein n=1 Tax=Streptomyces sp. Da 82-17 TaxID=3377116 RepID=UPI0038D44C94